MESGGERMTHRGLVAIQQRVKAQECHRPRSPTACSKGWLSAAAKATANASMMGNSARAAATAAGTATFL